MSFRAYGWMWLVRAFSGTFGAVSTLATFVGVAAIVVVSIVPAAPLLPLLLTDLRLPVGVLLLAVRVPFGCRRIHSR